MRYIEPRGQADTSGAEIRASSSTRPARWRGRGQAGTASLELMLVVPVLVLLTVFVLWAGRAGRARLVADLAAGEAAAAAALCCENGSNGAAAREVMVEDLLEARPSLEFLCIGGVRPTAPDQGSGGPEFVQEHWVDFDSATSAGFGTTDGMGVLVVRFQCETDGALAPLAGVFPIITVHGQATEVVIR